MKKSFTLGDVHHADFEQHVFELTVEDIKRLASRKAEFRPTSCPACLSADSTLEYELFGLEYHRCGSCRTVYLSPCPQDDIIVWYLNTSQALKYWRDNMPESVRQTRKSKLYKARVDFVLNQLGRFDVPPNWLVDVGGGNGEFVEELSKRAGFKKLTIVEPQPLTLADPAIEIISSPFQEFNPNGNPDVIVAFEVLEHIVEPHLFLTQVRKLLSAHGVFILSTPNIEGFETSVLKLESRALWFDHVRLYNPSALTVLMNRSGFEVLAIETPGELDVEIVAKAAHDGRLKVEAAANAALCFLLASGSTIHEEFQRFLRQHKLSSHMVCIARPRLR